MRSKVALRQRIVFFKARLLLLLLRDLLKLERTRWRNLLLLHHLLMLVIFSELCHGLLLGHESTLVTLTLQDSFLTLVLGDARDLRLAILAAIARIRSETSVAFGGAWPLLLATAICGPVTLLHDFCLGNVVHLLLLIAHTILLIYVLRERVVVRYSPLPVQEQAVVVLL